MPRGIAILFSTRPKAEIFKLLEGELNKRQFNVEYPNSDLVEVWDSTGEMRTIPKQEALHLLDEEGSVIVFWRADHDSVAVAVHQGTDGLSDCTVYLDGLNKKGSYEILSSLLQTIESSKTEGMVFDRSEITEYFDWTDVFCKGVEVCELAKRNHLMVVDEKNRKQPHISETDFCESNAYVVVKTPNNVHRLSVLKSNLLSQ